MCAYYPQSKIELSGFTAVHYDTIMDVMTLGRYSSFIGKAVESMGIRPGDIILDMGAGTGRNACLMAERLSGKGKVIGIDISRDMISRFRERRAVSHNVEVVYARIDRPLPFKSVFDKVFMSFVLHGFPQDVREVIIKNAFDALKSDGDLYILDYNEFSFEDLPFYGKAVFKLIECPYAFDFIERDWKRILGNHSFGGFEEFLFFKNRIRLLKARKHGKQ